MSGTGQAFNSLSWWVSYPVTMGHRTNTQRNDVLEERKKKQRQGAENKIKEACILYTTVELKPQHKGNLAAEESVASTAAFSLFLKR